MEIGVVSRSFPDLTNEETALLMEKNNIKWTELCLTAKDSNYWVYNGRSDMSAFTNEESIRVVETYRRHGVIITALGVFTNLLELDENILELNFQYFERYMELASLNNIPYVSTEIGFDPVKRGILSDTYESAFDRLVKNYKRLAIIAEKYNVIVALETCVLDIIPSAKRARDFLNQVGSDRIKILLDPANLIANSSEEDMFHYLKEHIAYFHGKDRKVNDAYGRIIGDGDIDWSLFLKLYHKYTEGIPFILEYVNSTNFREVGDKLLSMDVVESLGN